MLDFQLFGPFAVVDPDGRDLRPKLLKSRAILAVLAATPRHSHARSWFQTLLWEDRQPAQAQASLRTALADIRKSLGPHADVLISSHSDIALDPSVIRTDLDQAGATAAGFLEGFDIAHAENFEDWLREMRAAVERPAVTTPAMPRRPATREEHVHGLAEAPALYRGPASLYLAPATDAQPSMTQLACEALVDGLAKSVDDFGLGGAIDGRYAGPAAADPMHEARRHGCGLVLFSETAEFGHGAIARLKVIDPQSSRLIWSKSLTAQSGLSLDDPATLGVVAEFVDLLAHRMSREVSWTDHDVSPDLRAMAGVHRAFKLGMQNFQTADSLLERAYAEGPKAVHLAWRAFLRTFMLCEFDFGSPESVIDEGVALARRAMEQDPHNAMVLALCAHVENVMNLSHERATDLAMRALDINRCNPMAWASLGVALAFRGKAEDGRKMSVVGAKMAAGSWYSAQADSWASVAAVLAGDIEGARRSAESSHQKSPAFAPPMRYLSALYCVDGQYDRALEIADKLRVHEPEFTFARLTENGYPADSLRQANVLTALPGKEI